MLTLESARLAAGKGVTVAPDRESAGVALEQIFVEGRFGAQGASAVVEELLERERMEETQLTLRVVPLVLETHHQEMVVMVLDKET